MEADGTAAGTVPKSRRNSCVGSSGWETLVIPPLGTILPNAAQLVLSRASISDISMSA
jgi:hypothetical protein